MCSTRGGQPIKRTEPGFAEDADWAATVQKSADFEGEDKIGKHKEATREALRKNQKKKRGEDISVLGFLLICALILNFLLVILIGFALLGLEREKGDRGMRNDHDSKRAQRQSFLRVLWERLYE